MTDLVRFIRDRLEWQEELAGQDRHRGTIAGALLLRDAQAKSRMLELHESTHHCPANESTLTFDEDTPCPVLRWLAYPFADHPDARPALDD